MDSPTTQSDQNSTNTNIDTLNVQSHHSDQNKAPKSKFPHHNHPKWDIFWILMAILFIVVQLVFLFNFKIPLTHYLPLAAVAIIALFITFFWSSKSVMDGYSISKQAICYMGSLKGRRTGVSNKKALILFILFGSFYGMLNFTLMHFYWTYYPTVGVLTNARWTLFLSTLSIIMMAIIPIDINEVKHLYSALAVFIITEVASGFSVAYFIMEGISFPLLYVIVIIEFIFAAGYIYGYIFHYRYAPVFQKSCIMFTGIASFLYLTYLVGIQA